MNKQDALQRLASIEEETRSLRAIIEAPEDIYIEINSYEDICKKLGITILSEADFHFLPVEEKTRQLGLHKIGNITKVFNEGIKIDFSNTSQDKWYNWFEFKNNKWVFCGSHYRGGRSGFSPSVYFATEKAAKHCAKLFLKEYQQYFS